MEGTSYLELTMPDQVEFSCLLAAVVGIRGTCQPMGGNVLRFDSPWIEDDGYPGGSPIVIEFRNRILPPAELMIKGIKIETYQTLEGVDYLIDTFEDFALEFFAPGAQLFLSSQIITGSDEVYTMTDFIVVHKLANSVPSDAIMHLTIPK